MKNLRTWGKAPYKMAVVHGGPGMPGHIAPVARELAKDMGVLEPLQTKNTIDGQVDELAEVVKKNAECPVVLIGHSWGAILSNVMTARYPVLVKKLILIGTAPLEPLKGIPDFPRIRFERLSKNEQAEMLSVGKSIEDGTADKDGAMRQYSKFTAKGDAYELGFYEDDVLEYQLDVGSAVGAEMMTLLSSGEYLNLSKQITCPVVAICGDYDPRPYELVRDSLSRVHKDFKFVLLEKCGHTPWVEKYARNRFYEVLREEII